MTGARRVLQLVSVVACAAATGTCVTDLFTGPRTDQLEIIFPGDSLVVVGSRFVPAIQVKVRGTPLDNARLRFQSSDSNVVDVGHGDSLLARGRGRARVTVTLQSALLPESGPGAASISRNLFVVVKTMALDRSAITLTSLDDTTTLVATAMDANDEPVAAVPTTWESSDSTVASVNATGRVLARGVGVTEVRTTLDRDTVRASVRVRQDLAVITLSPVNVFLSSLDEVATVAASGRDARDNVIVGFSPTWESANANVARVDAAGTVRARQNGETYLRARSGNVVDSVPVNVDQQAVEVVIGPEPVPLITAVGGQRQLVVTALDRLGHTVLGDPPTWGTLTPLVLRVSIEGLVTGVAEGTGQVLAFLDGVADTATVLVQNMPVSIEVLPATLTLTSLADTTRLTATVRNARADTIPAAPVSWTTPDAPVAGVLPDGRVIALAIGFARVIGWIGDLRDTSLISVTDAPATVAILPTADTLASIGDSVVPAADVRNARGAVLPRTSVIWSSDDWDVARVTTEGIVIAQGIGRTVVRATFQALDDSIVFVVTNAPVAIVLDGTLDTLTALGQTLSYTAQVQNARGTPIPDYPVSWRSTNGAVAQVSSTGTVTALGFGTALVIGSAGAIEDTIRSVVRNPTRLHVDNAAVVQSRFGTLARPFERIQDAVAVADANDSILVGTGASPYAETIVLSKRITLLGDSSAYVAAGYDPLQLPRIAHDTGAAGITAYTTAPVTIGYLALVHTLDGPAIDARGTDIRIEHFHVNPPGTVGSPIGRGMIVKDSPSGSRLARSSVRSVRAYGIRFEGVLNGVVEDNAFAQVDSLAGVGAGAGIRILKGSNNRVRRNTASQTQGPQILLDSTATAGVTANALRGRHTLLRMVSVTGSTEVAGNLFDLRPGDGETVGSAADGRAGLEIGSSSAVFVTQNRFTDTTTSAQAMDAVRLSDARDITLSENGWDGGRYQIRSARSRWSSVASRFTGAIAAVVAEEADTIQLTDDTLTVGRASPCVVLAAPDIVVTALRVVVDRCASGGGVAIGMSGGGELELSQSTFAGAGQRAVSFSGRRFTARGNTFSGTGGTAPAYSGTAVLSVAATDSAILAGNEVIDYRSFDAILVSAPLVRLDSNRVTDNVRGVRLGTITTFRAVDNDIADHDMLGAIDEGAGSLVAGGNWWGDSRGPRSGISAATGDSVAGSLTVTPLRTTPFYPGTTPSGLRTVRGNNQIEQGSRNMPLALTVRVIDDLGRPVSGVSVTFASTSGGATLNGVILTTVNVTSDGSGLAEVTLRVGGSAGPNTVTVSGTSLPLGSVTFTATAI